MATKKWNLEDWFTSLNNDKFPGKVDYISKYKTIRSYMNDEIHSEIKAIVVKIINDTYLNDHGEKHIKKVIEKASELLKHSIKYLSPYETFFLLLAIQIHDAGHIFNGRKDHARNAQLIINKFGKENLSTVEKKYISQIAKAHSGKDDPIGILNEDQVVSSQKVNLKLIASIVRLADELADDSTRASTFLLDNGLIDDSSKIFHIYSQSLDSCIVESNQIRMIFYLNEDHLKNTFPLGNESVFLLDEIYKRTAKTFTESLYCNRFLPEEIRIKSVNVQITIESEYEEIVPKEIRYRLEEVGYPRTPFDDIFDFCQDLINSHGDRLSGHYYKELIAQRNISHEQKSI